MYGLKQVLRNDEQRSGVPHRESGIVLNPLQHFYAGPSVRMQVPWVNLRLGLKIERSFNIEYMTGPCMKRERVEEVSALCSNVVHANALSTDLAELECRDR